MPLSTSLPSLGLHGTFLPNHKESIHRWYPYLEGFSSSFVQRLLDEFGYAGCRIHDPFSGTGTTMTVASERGMLGFYSEINPFMRLVIECKTNGLRAAVRHRQQLKKYFEALEKHARLNVPSLDEALVEQSAAFGKREIFVGSRLREIIAIKRAIAECEAPISLSRDFARLALGSIAVACSEMKRAADLRYRTSNEMLPDDFSVFETFHQKLLQISSDVDEQYEKLQPVTCIGESALKQYPFSDYVDVVLTSPPYLNGTNYFRNTKIELWLTGFLHNENELGSFRDQAMAAGINDISRRGRQPTRIPEVEAIASELDDVAYDVRIPEMVRRYCSDSMLWVQNIFKLLKPGGTAIIDIGDSRFAGVHIPTDHILRVIAEQVGLSLSEQRPVRTRKSKDGTALGQVLLILKKPGSNRLSHGKEKRSIDHYRRAAVEFEQSLPHAQSPFSSRNWGHGLHSLCSYQGKLKPAIAHFLVDRFTSPAERVLDPMSGSGGIPLEAFLQGRYAVGNDLQELGYILTRAKVERGDENEALSVLKELLQHVEQTKDEHDVTSYADFGFNGKLPQYFHETTYREILAARAYLKQHPCNSWGAALVYSCLLHILHGNRPYALSRRSHPVTPFAPTGEFIYKPLALRLTEKVNRTLRLPIETGTLNGIATQLPFTQLSYWNEIDAVITSPPFAASTRFFIANWMRLWMAGWEPGDFTSRREEFLEHQQRQSMDAYHLFFSCCFRWLKPGGKLIMHVGRTASCNMAEELLQRAGDAFALVHWFDETVAGREKFGIRDQGATTSHQYLFFRRRD